jgi:hypothetical protein
MSIPCSSFLKSGHPEPKKILETMRLFRSVNLLLLVCLLPFSAVLAQVSVKAELDSTYIFIGSPINLNISVNQANGIRLLEPQVDTFDRIENLELLSSTNWDTIQTNPNLFIQKSLTITAWDSGYYQIPSLVFPYEINGKLETKVSNSIPLEVKMIEVDTNFIEPIKTIVEEPLTFEDLLPWLISLGFLLVVAAAILLYLNDKKRKAKLPEIVPKRPYYELILEQLDQLEAGKLWQQGQTKEYHSRLTHLLREYLEKRFRIQALEQTTREIQQQLQKKDLPEDRRSSLGELLQTADMVKFAKAEPPAAFHEDALRNVRGFIEETIPQPDLEQTESVADSSS